MLKIFFSIPLALIIACSSIKKVPVVIVAEMGPEQYSECGESLSKELVRHIGSRYKKFVLSLKRIRNRTTEHIDTYVLQNTIKKYLVQNNIVIVNKYTH